MISHLFPFLIQVRPVQPRLLPRRRGGRGRERVHIRRARLERPGKNSDKRHRSNIPHKQLFFFCKKGPYGWRRDWGFRRPVRGVPLPLRPVPPPLYALEEVDGGREVGGGGGGGEGVQGGEGDGHQDEPRIRKLSIVVNHLVHSHIVDALLALTFRYK